MKRIITFGTFDLLHKGHLSILERAKAEGDYLIVGVSTDSLNARKGKSSVFSEAQRLDYVKALECVDEVFLERSLDEKDKYIREHRADMLVMGDDWQGKFDWVSCEVKYLPRTEGVSSTELKEVMLKPQRNQRILFGDTYVKKHYDCAVSIVNELMAANIIPIFTQTPELPRNLNVDCIAYFNRPSTPPPPDYDHIPKVCIDHGASNLKWFLSNPNRFHFFDRILTAGPDHSKSLLSFFPISQEHKVRSAGFIKAADLLNKSKHSRDEVCARANIDTTKPMILFVPTWYISKNIDVQVAIDQLSKVPNHVALLHPETAHIDSSRINVVENVAGSVTEYLKHADLVVSDLSSTIFEAAALGKPVVQVLMREYSDNNATNFDFPYVAGTTELFCGGVPCRPSNLAATISDVLSRPDMYSPMLRECQRRILSGTVISPESTNLIISELLLACKDHLPKRCSLGEVEAAREKGLARVHQDLALTRHLLIAHGGGNFQGHHASNSREAIRAAFRSGAVVEVDLVLGKDSIFLAHDGFEAKYALEGSFENISVDRFSKARFEGALRTMDLGEFFEMLGSTSNFSVFDIKNTNDQYKEVARKVYELACRHGVQDQIILQAYCKQDFEFVCQLGVSKAILPVWKYFYRDPLGPDARGFIEECLAINSSVVRGISIPYYNHHMQEPSVESPNILPFFGYFKRIFIHGAAPEEYPQILRRGMGLFADSITRGIEFKDVPPGFSWRRYMFLNQGLVDQGIDNQVSAVRHYVEWGQKEGRLVEYEVPDGFNMRDYLDRNKGLRSVGIGGIDSAKAHWTRVGSKQGLRT